MAHDVFVSYASEDKPAADAICAILEGERIRCWMAPRDILPGTSYAKAIMDAIDGARVLVVVFSSSTNRSPHVPREAELAVKRAIPILPIRLEEALPSDALGYYLAGQHWLDALVPPLEASIRRLAEAVHVLLGAPSTSGARRSVAAAGSTPAEPGIHVAPGQPAGLVEPRTGMELIHVAPGSFEMGDLFGDGEPNEVPVRVVAVAGFLIGKFPVTQRQWEAVMGFNPSRSQGPDLPVTNVSWLDAQEFISALSGGSSTPFRLPTEAEWEYAARSGGKKEKWAGTSQPTEVAAVAWTYANSGARTHPVGSRRPNGLGLFDMSGNVWEWCSDRYQEVPSGRGCGAPEPQRGRAAVRLGSIAAAAGSIRLAMRGRAIGATAHRPGEPATSGFGWLGRSSRRGLRHSMVGPRTALAETHPPRGLFELSRRNVSPVWVSVQLLDVRSVAEGGDETGKEGVVVCGQAWLQMVEHWLHSPAHLR